MAIFDVDFPDDFMSGLLDTDFDAIAEAALTDAAPLLERQMKKCCSDAIQHEGDSELVGSIKSGTPKQTKDKEAWIVNVGPRGYSTVKKYTAVDGRGKKTKRKYHVSNALKAIWKEYGIPGHQPPRPFLQAATDAARHAVEAKIQEVYDRMAGK